MTGVGGPSGWPAPLAVGAALLGLLTLAATVGPLFTTDPAAIVDPRGAAVLAPGARRWVVVKRDGSTLAAERAQLVGETWKLQRLGQEVSVPRSQVATVTRRLFLLGTDTIGRDVLARLVAGARVSLAIATLALAVSLLLGISIGMVSGWRGGVFDAVVMRVVDGLLAIPMLFLLLLVAALLRPSVGTLVVILGVSSWMGVARLARGQVLSLKEREFILASRAIGAGPARIMAVHLLPNASTPLAQDAALRLGDLILVEASLSFLGLGVQPPTASWGNMVAEGQEVMANAWWLTFLPAAMVCLTVIGAALVADGLQARLRGGITAGETS